MNITTYVYAVKCTVVYIYTVYTFNLWATSHFCADKTKQALDIELIWIGWHRWSPTTGNKAFSYSSTHLIKYLVTPALETVSVFPTVSVSNDRARHLKNYLKPI